MASPRDERRQPGPFTLPPIAQMTRDMPQDKSPKQNSTSHEMTMRDSGMWSMQSPSKHSSTISSGTGVSGMSSSNGLQLQTILNSDDSPHRFSSTSAASGGTPASARYSHQGHPLPALNRSITNEHNPRASIDANNTFFIDSRRSSIDSRSNVNLDSLALNPSSPYESHNPSHRASEASLASSFQQPPTRNSNPPIPPRSSGPTAAVRRPVTSGGAAPRRAPQIAPNPRQAGVNPTSSQPTKGFAWAFPDTKEEDEMQDSLTPESSRHGSLAGSSINNIDSNIFPLRHATSHHTLPPKTLSGLSSVDTIGTGNYSRTPELRVSHKLAERKRRSEMKDLFDNLNRILPNSPGNKSSKWEVLSKAIEYIDTLKHHFSQTQRENEKLRNELEHMRATAEDNQALNSEITVMYQQICRLDPNGHKIFGQRTHQLAEQDRQQPPQPHRAGQPPYAPMQGVEYGYDRR